MIGNDMQLDSGIGTCGKEGQGVPVGRRPADAADRQPDRRRHRGMRRFWRSLWTGRVN